jgi:hypothetical protein
MMNACSVTHIVKYEVISGIYLETDIGLICLKSNVFCFLLNNELFLEQHYILCYVNEDEITSGFLKSHFKKIKTYDDVKVKTSWKNINKNYRVSHKYIDKYGKFITEYSKWYKNTLNINHIIETTINEILIHEHHCYEYKETLELERGYIRIMKLKEIISDD